MLSKFLGKIKLTQSENTHKTYKNTLFHIYKKGEYVSMNEDQILSLVSEWKKEVSINTIRHRLIILRSFLAHINDPTNVCISELIQTIRPEVKIVCSPTVDAVNSIIDLVDNPRDKVIILLMAQAGARISEVQGIQLDNVMEDRILVTGTKNNEEKYLRISSQCKQYLSEYLKVRKKTSTALFTSSQGQLTISGIQNIIKKLKAQSGSKIHCHAFRHFFCQMLIDNNTSLPIVQKAMGHKSISSTQKYYNVRYDTAFNAIDNVFG